MGCVPSKIGDTEAVALCRSRLVVVDEAVRRRYALSVAHIAYLHSLNSVGVSLHRFFQSSGDLASVPVAGAPSSVLNLPNDRKIEDEEYPGHHLISPGSSSETGSGHHNHHLPDSSLDSHIHFEPDSDTEDDATSNVQTNFMKKNPTSSISYQQKPLGGAESIQFGFVDPNSGYYPYYMDNPNPNLQFYGDPYQSGGSGYMGYGTYGGGMGGFYGGPSTSNNPPPPPPPPPETTSNWDFLFPFEIIESSYPPYTPSRASKASKDSKEVREEEGIPDLEDEDIQREVLKEVHHDQKLVDKNGDVGGGKNNLVEPKEEIEPVEDEAGSKAIVSVMMEPNTIEYEVHQMDKEVVVAEEGPRSEEEANVGALNGGTANGGFKNVFEVVREIQVQFERASDSGGELAKMLEAGKMPYHCKSSDYQVSSKMLCAAPSLPATSDSAADVDEATGLSSGNLSATLHKLYLWEKKLFEEVKVEEKHRVAHDKKVKKLRWLDKKGAEPYKVDATRSAMRDLTTKIRISIQIIDKISNKISKLRDEELWLQLNELIQGFSRMWKAMLECHHIQWQAVEGATGLDAVVFSKNSTETHLEAVLQLEQELINWTLRFTNWIDTQKGCVRALNEWLLKCLVCEPEVTADGVAPFSPGRAGAPPVFVICNQWAQSLERLSEKEVVESLRAFAAMVMQFWEKDKVEMQQRMVADKDVEKMVKNLQREDMKIQKQIQALDKKMVGEPNSLALSSDVVYQSDTKTSLQSGLQHIFEAMDRYTGESVKVYEELMSRSEEVVREHAG